MFNARTRPRVKGNRLVEVRRDAGGDETAVATYEYWADNRRSEKVVTNSGVEESDNDGGNTTVRYYYSNKWQILETRDGSDQATRQWVWGTQYVDEPLFMDYNADPGTDDDCDPDVDTYAESMVSENEDRRYYYQQDRNWNVIALTETDDDHGSEGRVVERYAYTPYGEFIVLAGDSGDGQLGNVLLTSTVGNPFTHQGLHFDQELGGYQNRWRWYDAPLQRFGQTDSLGYRDGMNMYSYQRAQVHLLDPLGQNTSFDCLMFIDPFTGAAVACGPIIEAAHDAHIYRAIRDFVETAGCPNFRNYLLAQVDQIKSQDPNDQIPCNATFSASGYISCNFSCACWNGREPYMIITCDRWEDPWFGDPYIDTVSYSCDPPPGWCLHCGCVTY
ncbi:MAG: RHS repeat-associated core domain-containing protein [Planctomycetota bacterium]